jgi:FkbM family methyltransferase
LIFEPHPKFYNTIVNRFKNDQQVSAYPFGLGARTETVSFSVANNASSVFDKSDEKEEVQIVSVKEFLEQHKISQVDLIKINIEGGEYELLEDILDSNMINVFNDIQVQFHDFFPEAKNRMNRIQERLAETHELTYQYEFIWENWRKK